MPPATMPTTANPRNSLVTSLLLPGDNQELLAHKFPCDGQLEIRLDEDVIGRRLVLHRIGQEAINHPFTIEPADFQAFLRRQFGQGKQVVKKSQ